MKASDLFVAALEREGVEYVFGIPGEENLDLLDSLSRSDIRLVLTRHEQAAGFMAATYGRLTGQPGVCLATLGPGATNLVTAAAYANLGGMPMVMLTGQKPIRTSKQGLFQIVDIVEMMRPLTKFTRQIESADRIPSMVREAFRRAHEERPGATHLELPEDVAQETSDRPPSEQSFVRRPVAEIKAIDRAVGLLSNAERPLLLIGAGANRNRSADSLRAFVESSGIRFVTTQMGKGVVDERHPGCIGNAALSSGDFVHRAIDTADVIVNVGHDVVEKPPFFMRPGGRTVIHVNFTSAEVDPVYFPQLEVVGDIADSIADITERLPADTDWDYERFDRVRDALKQHIDEDSADRRFPIYPQHLAAVLRRIMPDDGIVTLDNGIYKIWFARNYPAAMPNTVLLDNALATMGAGLPSAIAAAMVCPGQKVVAVCGDGGFMMNSAELETAVRLGVDLTVVILRDDALGMIKWKQEFMDFRSYGLDFGNPDFVRYAEAYGVTGHRISSAAELEATLRDVIDSSGVHLVDVPIDYSDNDRVLHHEISQLSRAI